MVKEEGSTDRDHSRAISKEEHRNIIKNAVIQSVFKLNPRSMMKNPVMFIVEIGSSITTILFFLSLFGPVGSSTFFIGLITVWLWFTVIFANYSEALAEGREKRRPMH